ncbi:AAA family ATPase [Mycoplasmopsis citelli]|nr:AAA family ATPase [Mycoplasmopsis citelli]
MKFKNGPKKFLFQGPPGIGKTHCVGVLTNTTKRQLYLLNWVQIISKSFEDYKKYLDETFEEINKHFKLNEVIILLENIEVLLEYQNHPEYLKYWMILANHLKYLNEQIILISTTNEYPKLPKLLVENFDVIIDFSQYSREELQLIAQNYFKKYTQDFEVLNLSFKLFEKIISKVEQLPFPGQLKKIIKNSLALSADTPNNF